MAGTPPRTPAARRRLSASDLSAEFKHRFSTLHWRHASNEQFVDDVTLDIFYRPHTLTLLGIGGAFLVYWAFVTREADSALERAIRGLQVRCRLQEAPDALLLNYLSLFFFVSRVLVGPCLYNAPTLRLLAYILLLLPPSPLFPTRPHSGHITLILCRP